MTSSSRPAALLALDVYLLSQVAAIGKTDMHARLRARSMTMPDMAVLAALDDGGACDQRSLSRRLTMDPSDVTGTVDRLANAGLIRREVHPGDRRRRVVALTETGAGCLRDLVRDAREVSDRLLAVLTADERAELRTTARRVLDHHDGRRRVSTESPDHGV